MDGLTEGRIVHYVTPTGKHRAAIVVDVQDKDKGICTLHVFSLPVDGMGGYFMNANTEYSQDPEIGTWHWIEKA